MLGFCLLVLLSVSCLFHRSVVVVVAHERLTTAAAAYVSPPFPQVVEQVYQLDAMKQILSKTADTVTQYNPPHGKFGIFLSILYGIRNARMAVQHYMNRDQLQINGQDWQWIWEEMYSYESEIFSAFHAWHSKHRTDEHWFHFLRVVLDVFGDPLKLKHYLSYFLQTNWDILLPVHYHSPKNKNAIKTYTTTVPHSLSLSNQNSTVTLNNGLEIPLIGFGSWPLTGHECKEILLQALANGYRMIDTSENYRNEEVIGAVLKETQVKRSEIIIADKLSFNENYGKGKTRAAFMESMRKMGVDYIDIYMTHGAISDKQRLKEAWMDMEELYREGRIKALAVSNYGVRDMNELMEYATVLPVLVQNKYDVFTSGQQTPWVYPVINEWTMNSFAEHGIYTQGYCILNAWPHQSSAVNDAHVQWIAEKYENRSPAQILIRWALQSGILVLTRSSNYFRQLENMHVFDFELNEIDMQLLTGLITLFSPYDVQWTYDVYQQVGNRPNLANHKKKHEL